jgi:beta-lactamase regulating signal transducer with metallopeptidase domain
MADFLVLLAKINLAMACAILIVALLRRPMRAVFHTSVAYALWLLVPVTAVASLLPPRVIAVAVHPVNLQIPVALTRALPARLAAQAPPFDWTLLLFVAWSAGAGAMALFMVWQQQQFHKAERRGAAGPAVTGFVHPRIVVPDGFAKQFSAPEQAAILAHETAHLARQDARINALVALLRCLCWFNPLVQVGALWLRKDQELACDAAATARVPRIDYANALLKSQMRAIALPVGCSWPGREHPLTERVALLKRPLPTRVRQRAGIALVLSLTAFAGAGAWAAQPADVQPAGKHNFTGLIFYSQQDGKNGPLSMMSLESDDGKNAKGKPWLGHEVLHFPYGVAWADNAQLDRTADKSIFITMSGNVRLLYGSSGLDGLKGQKLMFDARTGQLDFDGKQMPSGMPKYVPCTKDCKLIEK